MGNDQVIVNLYGTRPVWTVQIPEAQVSGVTAPDEGPDRREEAALQTGQEFWIEDRSDGFTVSIQRTVSAPGLEPGILTLTSTYQPARGALLVAPASPR